MNRSNLIFLDTETTGTGPDDRLCQVAYSFEGREVGALFKPPVAISVDAMSVTHITNQMVAECPVFSGSALHADLAAILRADNVLVAHNAKFDIEMLRHEGLEVKTSIDTYKIAQHLDAAGRVPKYNLQYLRYYHELEVANASAHSALGDVRVLERLFDFYFQKMLAVSGDEEGVLREMIEISARPILIKKFNFGKYSGADVKKVAIDDPSYLAWLFNQKVMARERGEDDDENWIYTLDHYLAAK